MVWYTCAHIRAFTHAINNSRLKFNTIDFTVDVPKPCIFHRLQCFGVQICDFPKIAWAARFGDISLIQQFEKEYFNDEAANAAACFGHLNILQWKNVSIESNGVMYYAIKYGHLHIAQWLYDTDEDTEHEMDDNSYMILAAANGHLHIVKWMHQEYGFYCDNNVFIIAAKNGHLKVVKWLHSHCNTCCTSKSIYFITRNNTPFKVLQWIIQNKRTDENYSELIFEPSVRCGNLEEFQWLLSNCTIDKPFAQTYKALLTLAMDHGYLELVKLLYKLYTEAHLQELMAHASKHECILEYMQSVLSK